MAAEVIILPDPTRPTSPLSLLPWPHTQGWPATAVVIFRSQCVLCYIILHCHRRCCCCCLCSTTWAQAGISLYQARTGEGLDLSDYIGSQAVAYAGAAPLPRPLPHSHSLMGLALTTDPNCLWTALHVLLVPDCLGSCQQAIGSRDRIATAIIPLLHSHTCTKCTHRHTE